MASRGNQQCASCIGAFPSPIVSPDAMREGEVTRRRAINRSVLLTDLSVRLLHAVGLLHYYRLCRAPSTVLLPSTQYFLDGVQQQNADRLVPSHDNSKRCNLLNVFNVFFAQTATRKQTDLYRRSRSDRPRCLRLPSLLTPTLTCDLDFQSSTSYGQLAITHTHAEINVKGQFVRKTQ